MDWKQVKNADRDEHTVLDDGIFMQAAIVPSESL